MFWAIVFRFFGRKPFAEAKPRPRKHGVLCGICEDVLRPTPQGYRSECGKFYHVACAATVEECARCHRPMRAGAKQVAAGLPAEFET